MVDVASEIIIDRDRNAVAAFAGDPDRAPEWYANIKSVDWKSPKPLTLGTLLAFNAHFLGRRLSYTYEVVDHVPGQRLVMRTVDGPFPMETTYEWTSVSPRSTRMTLRNRGEPSGFSAIAGPFVAFLMRRENRKDLSRLKVILERGL